MTVILRMKEVMMVNPCNMVECKAALAVFLSTAQTHLELYLVAFKLLHLMVVIAAKPRV